MQKLINIAAIIVVIIALSCCYLVYNNYLTLDESAILRDTRSVFVTTAYNKAAFHKKYEIQQFTDFLMRHSEEIQQYHRHQDVKSVQISDTGHLLYSNGDACFYLPTFHEKFIQEYIPPQLADSIYTYSAGLRSSLITGFTLCDKHFYDNLDTSAWSISYTLAVPDTALQSMNCYVFHQITQNLKSEKNDTISSIYGGDLSKDTLLFKDLRYQIIVRPYSGF